MTTARRAADAGAGVVVVLHYLNLAAAFADRIVLMDGGRIVSDAAPAEVLTEAHLTRIYAAPLRILPGPGGRPVVVPVYPGLDAGYDLEECHDHHGTEHPYHRERRLSQSG